MKSAEVFFTSETQVRPKGEREMQKGIYAEFKIYLGGNLKRADLQLEKGGHEIRE